ncbi:MAG: hypothetical protein QM723_34320 [Myxococcaceae bacterium]
MADRLSDAELGQLLAAVALAGATRKLQVDAVTLHSLAQELTERRKRDTTRIVLTLGVGPGAANERWAVLGVRPWRFRLVEAAQGQKEHGSDTFQFPGNSQADAVAALLHARKATAGVQVIYRFTELGVDGLWRQADGASYSAET